MKIYFEGYPFSPQSGRIISETDTTRIERYYRMQEFKGDYFDIVYTTNEKGDTSFTISDILNSL